MLCLLELIWRLIRSDGRPLFRATIYDSVLLNEKQEMAVYDLTVFRSGAELFVTS